MTEMHVSECVPNYKMSRPRSFDVGIGSTAGRTTNSTLNLVHETIFHLEVTFTGLQTS